MVAERGGFAGAQDTGTNFHKGDQRPHLHVDSRIEKRNTEM